MLASGKGRFVEIDGVDEWSLCEFPGDTITKYHKLGLKQ